MTDEAGFVTAILDPAAPVPMGLCGPDGEPAGKRFDVYRNNVIVSLTEALETGFPVIRKLVGDAFFKAMAGVFVRQHPPNSPLMMTYGDAFPAFLEVFPPAKTVPYLADMARLELALRQSYHAADERPMDASRFQSLNPDALMAAGLTLARSVRLVQSAYAIHGIWQLNMRPDAPELPANGENVLVTRLVYDPVMDLLDRAQVAFVTALIDGRSFGAAISSASDTTPEFDLTQALGLLLSRGALVSLTEGPAS